MTDFKKKNTRTVTKNIYLLHFWLQSNRDFKAELILYWSNAEYRMSDMEIRIWIVSSKEYGDDWFRL